MRSLENTARNIYQTKKCIWAVIERKGRSFFDKIIQLPFKMPVASYDIRRYVKGMMERISISTDDREVDLFYSLIQTSIGFNPRSMKRLFNTYGLLDIVTGSTVANIDDSVRRRVLFAIICAQMCYEKLYLYFNSTRIDGGIFYGTGVNACLILMNNYKVPDHKNRICMIDASKIYTPARAQNYMSENDIQTVFICIQTIRT